MPIRSTAASRRRFSRAIHPLAAAMLLGASVLACSVETVAGLGEGEIVLTTASSTYYSQDVVQVTVANNTEYSLWSGVCFEQIEVRLAGVWIAGPTPGACFEVALSYAPGQSRELTFTVPDGTAPGQYRLRLVSLGLQDGRRLSPDAKVTNTFEIRAGLNPLFPPGEG